VAINKESERRGNNKYKRCMGDSEYFSKGEEFMVYGDGERPSSII
jgi:hypothetical protein